MLANERVPVEGFRQQISFSTDMAMSQSMFDLSFGRDHQVRF